MACAADAESNINKKQHAWSHITLPPDIEEGDEWVSADSLPGITYEEKCGECKPHKCYWKTIPVPGKYHRVFGVFQWAKL